MTVKEFVVDWKARMKRIVDGLDVKPSLLIVQVGDVEASNRYVKNKLKDCEEIGIDGRLLKLPDDITAQELLTTIRDLNIAKDKPDGIIIQLPLPKHITDEDLSHIMSYISPKQDVDGFKKGTLHTPCTPGGIERYLEAIGFEFSGKNAVVLGRSEIVGKPMAHILLNKDCTVTVCHSKTNASTRADLLRNADLIVSAVGKHGVLKTSEAPNAFIVDVGINFDENGKLCGDVINDNGSENVTPVPGGVGLLTRAMLMNNTLKAYSLIHKEDKDA